MTPVSIVHRMQGRSRLRARVGRGERHWFAEVGEALASCPGVEEVRVNPRTGSILVHHSAPLQNVIAFATGRGLFELAGETPRGDVLERAQRSVRGLELDISERTGGRFSLDAMMFYGLLGAGLFQVARGDVLPAGATLLLQAVSVLRRGGPDARGGD